MLNLLAGPPPGEAEPVASIGAGCAVQLSSGTTGHRKGVRIPLADVLTHVSDYNAVLGLTSQDCIVSWLPLYHDMGFIANFVMAATLGVPLVLIDPMTWIRSPNILFETIAKHRGTICYMPNFGFEVMARYSKAGSMDLFSMKRWISCSEPTRVNSMRKFMAATGTPGASLSNCYAMAENIFAVCQSDGLTVKTLDGQDVVSCGMAIPGVGLKIIDDEIWVRSAYSLHEYEGGIAVADADGFYPTGDLGRMYDGQLYVLGRKRDIMIHAGRKIILSDFDHELGKLLPENAGRVAAISVLNQTLGTEDPVYLIEDALYWQKNRDQALLGQVRGDMGIEQATVKFVAPGFITKTSSGKINRKLTAEHWLGSGRENSRRQSGATLGHRVLQMFPGLQSHLPFGDQLDSLGLVNLSLLMDNDDLLGLKNTSLDKLLSTEPKPSEERVAKYLNIVTMFDAHFLLGMMKPLVDRLQLLLGVTINFEHVCCPPASILLSDMIFDEQFRDRDSREGVYDGFQASINAIRGADIIITDDLVQMAWPALSNSHYPRLSHRFENAPLSDYLVLRWARYSDRNDQIATELVESDDISPAMADRALCDLEDYLGVPIVRIALTSQFSAQTAGWEIHNMQDYMDLLVHQKVAPNHQSLANALLGCLFQKCKAILPRERAAKAVWKAADQTHWCSWLANPDLVDFALDHYDSFLVLGKRGSLPYLSKEADRRGKALMFRSDLLCPEDGGKSYDCVLQTGSWGRPVTTKPIIPMMLAGWGEAPANLDSKLAAKVPRSPLHPATLKRVGK